MSNHAENIHAIQQIRKDDIVIAFMGPTGTGKSSFIDLLTGQKRKSAGHSLKSVTSQIQATRVRRPGYDDRIVLVDTPGFDDTTRSDLQVLQVISKWLRKTYSKEVKLSGIIYLHRITDERMAGSPSKNLRMFGELCGDVAMSQVILVSTMWECKDPMDALERRERELKEVFWKAFIEKGSKVERLQSKTTTEAWRIVDRLIEDCQTRGAVLLQKELVEFEMQLNETSAGKTLYSSLQQVLVQQKDILGSLVDVLEKGGDDRIRKVLEKEYAKIDGKLQKTFKEVEKMKIPLGRRIRLFLFGKRTRANAIKVPGV